MRDLLGRCVGFNTHELCPIVINTSFNVRGEPIVCTPEDAFRYFMSTDIDLLIVGNCVLEKGEQNPALKEDYKTQYPPD